MHILAMQGGALEDICNPTPPVYGVSLTSALLFLPITHHLKAHQNFLRHTGIDHNRGI